MVRTNLKAVENVAVVGKSWFSQIRN